MTHRVFLVACGVVAAAMAACAENPAGGPTAPSVSAMVSGGAAVADSRRLTFSSLTVDAEAVTAYAESGFTVLMRSGGWSARTTYGNPAPFVQFLAEPGQTIVGEALVTLPAPTYFASVDLYSSTTPIPYVIKGLRQSAVVFTLSGTTSNTYGSFRTINNPHGDIVDAISIALTNTSTGRNPMGFDTLVTSESPAAPPTRHALSGTVTDGSGGIAGARVRVNNGPDMGTSVTTDAGGAFRFDSLTAGALTLSVSAAGFKSASESVTLDSDKSVSVRLTPNATTPPRTPAPASATTIGFAGLQTDATPVERYAEFGMSVVTTSSGWAARTTYGQPAPFIQFYADGGTSETGRLEVTGDSPFTFFSAELYSSTTRIPYTMTGTRNGATVFTVTGELSNTFGAFRQVVNPHPDAVIDALSISLTNTPAAGRNPMGIDTIVVVRK
ncbi:MAG: hypothetical protein AMXMBFR57_07680 [Acidimicrobiia bacterium]